MLEQLLGLRFGESMKQIFSMELEGDSDWVSMHSCVLLT